MQSDLIVTLLKWTLFATWHFTEIQSSPFQSDWKDRLWVLDIHQIIILKCTLKEVGCSGFIWFWAGLVMGPCEQGNEYSNSTKGIELFEYYSFLCHPAQRHCFRQACCIHLWQSTVKMETVNFFMLLIPSYQTTQHHIPQDSHLHEITWNANLMQQCNFINLFLVIHVSGTYAHHQEQWMLSCSIWFTASNFWMGDGLESRCIGHVCSADGTVARHHLHRTHDPCSGSQDHQPSKNSVQKTICCNSTSNAPDDGRMYLNHVELRIH